MNKSIVISIFFLLLFGASFSQITSSKMMVDVSRMSMFMPGNFVRFHMDAIGNLYAIKESGQIKKIDRNGDSSQVYQDVKKWGRPEYMDVSNPLKIRVFYPNYLTIVTLDRLLNPRNTINLRTKNHFKVKGIATSYDNHIWIYDEQLCRIIKMDEEGIVLLESADLRNLIDIAPSGVRLFDQHGDLFLFDEKAGVFIFDYYGAYKKQVSEMSGKNGGVNAEFAYVLDGERLLLYHLKNGHTTEMSVKGIINKNEAFVMQTDMLYVLKSDGIYRCPLK